MHRVYLDHTATTPLDPRVLEAMLPYFTEIFGNASSVHWYGQQSKGILERSREALARAIGVQAGEVIFTSGGTESDNQAIVGVARAMKKGGRNHVITSQAEHHAVLGPCEELEKEGFEVTYLPVDSFGMIAAAQISEALRLTTGLVSIMHANNEVGTICQIKEIARVAHEHGAIVHTDAVQSLGKIPLDVENLGVDLMSLSAHKIYGPKGIGALVVRKGVGMEPLLHGGGQERGKRPGTENVPLAVGFARAVEIAVGEMKDESARLQGLRDLLEEGIRTEFSAALINGHPTDRLPHILNVSFDSSRMQLEGEMLVMNMDLQGIAVTSGSACTSGSMQPSHVLLAMGRDEKTAKATLRFSFGKTNTTDDVGYVLETLKTVLHRMVQ
ncbi:MAG TPA: cysteine desulfurase family protein [Bacteroidota bacterium]|nr:cysteine desulfurase family protein [Bacteroidota bacterium]